MLNYKKLMYTVRRKIGQFSGKKITDDFDWSIYNINYRGELADISKAHALILQKNDYIFRDGLLQKNNNKLPLHPNHRLLYETILQLVPNSVLEFGCGGGDHLHNVKILSPETKASGIELSIEQINLSKERHPDMETEIKQFDITLPLPGNFKQFDISFTQAVIMHIHTGNGHLVALSNLFQTSTKQVILMENWTRHNFMDDINKLSSLKIIPWAQLFFYYRVSEELRKPHIMIISSIQLNQYPILNDYKILSDHVN